MILRIARMELQKMFYSPIAWLVLIIFAIQTSVAFMQTLGNLVRYSELGYNLPNLTYQLYSHQQTGLFNAILRNLYLYIPLLTMGLLSRELGSGSIKLLFSSPVTNRQIVLGKFLSMMIFGFAMICIVVVTIPLSGFAIKDSDLSLILTGILGLYLVICTYSAIGLFMSSLTSYQIVAAIGSFTTFFVLGQVGRVWQSIDFVRDITYWLSINGRSGTFINGLICSDDLLYFILVSGLFIYFTIIRLKGFMQKKTGFISFCRYACVFIFVVLIGIVSKIPSLMVYYDSTFTKVNTLTPNSQNVISKLRGRIKITTYVNIFDMNASFGLPSSRNYDINRFKQYSRFYPNIDFEYKYYYALPVEESSLKSHLERYKGRTVEQALEKACEVYEMKTSLFKPGENYHDEIDLHSELNRFIRKITSEDGKISFLRTYNDIIKFPDESQITAAFKELVEELPIVAFVSGHDERDLNDYGSRGYFGLSKNKTFRYSLINNGFDFTDCNVSAPIDSNISILVISDVRKKFTVEEIKNLNNYIDRGGNLVIACDLKRQENINMLIEPLGVRFLPGQIVEYNKGYSMDMITAVPTLESRGLAYQFGDISLKNQCVTMPGAVGISYEHKSGFNYIPLFISDSVRNIAQIDSIGSWNELETTDFIDEIPKYNPESGETPGANITALALTRRLKEKEQKIILLGDADCFSNAELLTTRNEIRAQNFNMAVGMFYWLSDNKVPIDVRRPVSPDNIINLKKKDLKILNSLDKMLIPLILIFASLLILLRRRGR